jgi:sulfoxide reductase heme-binding subunit YedZ
MLPRRPVKPFGPPPPQTTQDHRPHTGEIDVVCCERPGLRGAGRRDAAVRLSTRSWVVLGAAIGILIVYATGQVLPAASAYQAQMRFWLAARASGITTYLLLTALVTFGLVLSHPTNQSTWRLSKRIFPWHENLFVFVVAFVVAHIVSIVVDPFAGVGILGSFVPGLSSYRSAPVALGTLGLYALLVSGLTARWTRLLPRGMWLTLHRVALVAWILSWMHGLTSGTDSAALLPMYVATGGLVLAGSAYRYWVSKKARPTFATSLPEGRSTRPGRSAGEGAPRPRSRPIAAGAAGLGRAPAPLGPVTGRLTEEPHR